MRYRTSLIILVLLFICSSAYAEVDSSVVSALGNSDEVNVVVILKESSAIKQGRLLKPVVSDARSEILSKLKVKTVSEIRQRRLRADSDYELQLKHRFTSINGFSGKLTKKGLAKLQSDPDVVRVYTPVKMRADMDLAGPAIQSDLANGLVYAGANLTGIGTGVCILDTGADYTHVNLGACTQTSFLTGDCPTIRDGYDYANLDYDPMDDHNHGTHVTGSVISNHALYRGIAPNAAAIVMKVLASDGTGDSSDVAAAIERCIDNSTVYNISVITMSLGTSETYAGYCDDLLPDVTAAINHAVAHNITVTVSAGNAGSTTQLGNPACIENATAISAVNDADAFAFNRNNVTDLIAPGVGIISTKRGGGTTSMSGTSMATPQAAAAAAIVYQYGRMFGVGYTRDDVEALLKNGGKLLYDSGSNLNHKKIQLYNTLTAPRFAFSPNLTNSTNGQLYINVTSTKDLSFALLEFNGINESMQGVARNWFLNKTGLSGDYNLRIYGQDSLNLMGASDAVTLYVDNAPQISWYAPISSTPNVVENSTLSFNHVSIDLDNDTLMFRYMLDGFQVSTEANFTYLPGFESAGLHNLTLYVSDGKYTIMQYWGIIVENLNRLPAITDYYPASVISITENNTLYFNLSAIDSDNDTLSYSWRLNEFLVENLTEYTHLFGFDSAGIHNVSVYVSDSMDEVLQSWEISVNNTNRLPTITNYYPPPVISIAENSSLYFNISASDIDNNLLSYFWKLDGIVVETVTEYTHLFDFDSAGIHNVSVYVSDSMDEVLQSWEISVSDVNRQPVIEAYSPETPVLGAENSPLFFNLSALDPDMGPLSYMWKLDGDIVSDSSNFTYAPNYESVGVYNLTAYVNDSEYLISQSWYVEIMNTNRAPHIDSISNITVAANHLADINASGDFNYSDADNDSVSVSYSAYLNASGQWKTNSSDAGNYTMAVMVSDYSLSHSVDITIFVLSCTESWACTGWSSCANIQQSRACADSASCGTLLNKPAESQSCSAPSSGSGGGGGGGGYSQSKPKGEAKTPAAPAKPKGEANTNSQKMIASAQAAKPAVQPDSQQLSAKVVQDTDEKPAMFDRRSVFIIALCMSFFVAVVALSKPKYRRKH